MLEWLIGVAIGFGVATTLDVLGSQAFGAQNYRNVELYYQRICTFLLFVGLLINVAYFYSAPILI